MERAITQRLGAIGLGDRDRYGFVLAPGGFQVSGADLAELQEIGIAAATFLRAADEWCRQIAGTSSHWQAVLERGIPGSYRPLMYAPGLPQTVMIDTVWTADGWRVVELDTTNRNGLGFPMVMRHAYNLPGIWKGTAAAWIENGWEGVVQVMANHHRFYEPYFRFFLQALGGTLVPEKDLEGRLSEVRSAERLLDLPVFNRGEWLPALIEKAAQVPVGVPPKHHLSSKALLALLWEEEFNGQPLRAFLPTTQLLRRPDQSRPEGFFVKLLQSGGAHGTFHNDPEQLLKYASRRRPQAVLQEALPIARRQVESLQDGRCRTDDWFIRFSIYVNSDGAIVDGDVTASQQPIVHGGTSSILTVPVL